MAMLVVGSVASQGANVSAAEQMTTGRIVAAWPSFALIGADAQRSQPRFQRPGPAAAVR